MINPISAQIKTLPHWRVIFRPDFYDDQNLLELQQIRTLVENHRVKLRGWDFPHLSRDRSENEYGKNWFGSQSDFMSHIEYWRFYQSRQFIYLSSVREVSEKEWDEKLRKSAHQHFFYAMEGEVNEIPGFFSILNFLYTVTEYFIFLSKLCNKGVYTRSVTVTIELKDILGFALNTDMDRAWWNIYSTKQSELSFQEDFSVTDIIVKPEELALSVIGWFFVRFGWDDLTLDVFKGDQENFLKGLL